MKLSLKNINNKNKNDKNFFFIIDSFFKLQRGD